RIIINPGLLAQPIGTVNKVNDPPGGFGLPQGRFAGPARLFPVIPEEYADGTYHEQNRSGDECRGGRLAATPAPSSLNPANPPGADGLAGQEPPQILCQIQGAAVAPGWFLLQALQANRFQITRDTGIQTRWWHRLL